MPPTPAWITRAATSSVPSFSSAPMIASSEPCTSALMTSGNSLRPAVLSLRHHLLERAAHAGGARRGLLALLAGAVIGDLAGAGFVLDHREAVAGLRRAGEAEHLDRHRRAGARRPARRCRRPARARGPIRRRRRRGRRPAACRAAPARSPPGRGRGRAWLRSRCLRPARSGLALRSRISACRPIISSSLSMLVFLVADTSTSTTSPPSDSTWISCCSSSVRTRSGLASGLSILLMATMIGTLAALA